MQNTMFCRNKMVIAGLYAVIYYSLRTNSIVEWLVSDLIIEIRRQRYIIFQSANLKNNRRVVKCV